MNKEEEKKENKKILFYAIVTIIGFIAVSVGTAYAFYTATVIGNATNGEVEIKTANVYAVYNSDKNLVAEGVLPGFSDTVEFSIINVSTSPNAYGNYSIIWDINENTINDKDFVYSLAAKTLVDGEEVNNINYNKVVNINNTKVPNESVVLGSGMINTGVTHKYVLRISFRENGNDQNDLQGKIFNSIISVKGEPVVGKISE